MTRFGRLGLLAASVAFATIAITGVARSFTTFCLPGWPNATGTFRTNGAGFPASAGGEGAVNAAIRAAAAEWTTRGGSPFRWVDGGTTTNAADNLRDGFTDVYWVNQTNGNVIAVTTCGGGVQGADVKFLNVSLRTDGSDLDIQAIATHEIGHALGLGHSTDSSATMYPTYHGVGGRQIEADDIAGIRSIYGVSSAPTILAVTPASGFRRGGDVVTIDGTNFDASTRVTFGASSVASSTIVSSTRLQAITPPSTTLGATSVSVSNGTSASTLAGAFVYVENDDRVDVVSMTPRAGGPFVLRVSGRPGAIWGLAGSDGPGPWVARPLTQPALSLDLGPSPPFLVRVYARGFASSGVLPLDATGVALVSGTIPDGLAAGSSFRWQAVFAGATFRKSNVLSATLAP
jgi:matrixin/IPT/TIG domain-containing protein